MKIHWAAFFPVLLAALPAQALEEKPVLDVAPTAAELGGRWTTNVVAYLLDPRSHPPEIDYHGEVATSPYLAAQREVMKSNHRTGCGLVLYGRGDLVANRGLYRVYFQRWTDTRSLHNAWVDWKMTPLRVVRSLPAVGEDYFWTNDWWRDTPVGQNLIFRRGLFHVVVEAGAESDTAAMVELAQVIDAKIRGKPLRPASVAPVK